MNTIDFFRSRPNPLRNFLLGLFLGGLCFGGNLRAASDLYTTAIRIDGLPLRLSETYPLETARYIADGKLDVSGLFQTWGIEVPEGGLIVYDPVGGMLVCRLSQGQHDLVDALIENLTRLETAAAVSRAYLEILEPLDDAGRVASVLKTGFFPDPVVSAMINRVAALRNPRQPKPEEAPWRDPFDPTPEPEKPETKPAPETAEKKAARVARIERMEKDLAKILASALDRMRSQLEILDAGNWKAGEEAR